MANVVGSDIALDSRGDWLISPNGLEIVTGMAMVIQYIKMALRSRPGDIRFMPGFGISLKEYASMPNTRAVAEVLEDELSDMLSAIPGTEDYIIVPTIYPTSFSSMAINLAVSTPKGYRVEFDVNVDYNTGQIEGFGDSTIKAKDPYNYTPRLIREWIVPKADSQYIVVRYPVKVQDQLHVFKFNDLQENFDPNVPFNTTKTRTDYITDLYSDTINLGDYIDSDTLDSELGAYTPTELRNTDTHELISFYYSRTTHTIAIDVDTIANVTLKGRSSITFARAIAVKDTDIEPQAYAIRPYMRDFQQHKVSLSRSLIKDETYIVQYQSINTM